MHLINYAHKLGTLGKMQYLFCTGKFLFKVEISGYHLHTTQIYQWCPGKSDVTKRKIWRYLKMSKNCKDVKNDL